MKKASAYIFNQTPTTEIYTLSLHDALPISIPRSAPVSDGPARRGRWRLASPQDRKSTRLNSSHANTSYAVFCLKNNKLTNYFLPVRVFQKHATKRRNWISSPGLPLHNAAIC